MEELIANEPLHMLKIDKNDFLSILDKFPDIKEEVKNLSRIREQERLDVKRYST